MQPLLLVGRHEMLNPGARFGHLLGSQGALRAASRGLAKGGQVALAFPRLALLLSKCRQRIGEGAAVAHTDVSHTLQPFPSPDAPLRQPSTVT